MNFPAPLNTHVDLVARVGKLLSMRKLNHFAEEARLDGESLREAIDRYDIDYAWHVLGSQRQLAATLDELGRLLQREPTQQQRTEVAAVLHAVANAQASEQLMSFDNDLAQQVADMLVEAWGLAQAEHAPSEAA